MPRGLADVATIVRNAATEEISGLEIDLSWQISERWFLRANYGYLDAKYEDFIADIDGGSVIEPTDNSYLRPRNTPENTFGINTTYTLPIGSGTLQGVLAYRYRDSIQVDLVSQVPTKIPSPADSGALGHGQHHDVRHSELHVLGRSLSRYGIWQKPDRRARAVQQNHWCIATRGYQRRYWVSSLLSF